MSLPKTITHLVPTGSIIAYGGGPIPDGWLICNGAVLSRSDYPDLYGAIGDAFEGGDGTTTFALPDLRDKFVEGAGTSSPGVGLDPGLPEIAGSCSFRNNAIFADSGESLRGSVGEGSTAGGLTVAGGDGTYVEQTLSAQAGNSIYGNSETVQPPSLCLRMIVRF